MILLLPPHAVAPSVLLKKYRRYRLGNPGKTVDGAAGASGSKHKPATMSANACRPAAALRHPSLHRRTATRVAAAEDPQEVEQ